MTKLITTLTALVLLVTSCGKDDVADAATKLQQVAEMPTSQDQQNDFVIECAQACAVEGQVVLRYCKRCVRHCFCSGGTPVNRYDDDVEILQPTVKLVKKAKQSIAKKRRIIKKRRHKSHRN